MTYSKEENAYRDYYLMREDILNSKMDLHERLRLGFPIAYNEISYLKNILNYYKLYPLSSNVDMDIKKMILAR